MNRHPEDRAARRFISRCALVLALVASVAVLFGLLSGCRNDRPSTAVGALAASAHRGTWTGCTPGPVQAGGAS